MIGGIVEIADSGRHVSIYRGFLKVSDQESELGRVPLGDITALILSGPQITLSKAVMVELAERKAVIVTSGRNWHPISMTLPFGVHFEAAGILNDQIKLSEPNRKRMWQQIVKCKIGNQACVLEKQVPDSPVVASLYTLQKRVKSGDPDNMEAQAARQYWPALLGAVFRRDRHAEDTNVYLNYGYTVLRAAAARAVCGSGLHPSLGLHHGNRVNAFALVDDVMEPFRPLVDQVAKQISENTQAMGPNEKRQLAAVLQADMIMEHGVAPAMNCITRLAQSLVRSVSEGKAELALPTVRPGDLLV